MFLLVKKCLLLTSNNPTSWHLKFGVGLIDLYEIIPIIIVIVMPYVNGEDIPRACGML